MVKDDSWASAEVLGAPDGTKRAIVRDAQSAKHYVRFVPALSTQIVEGSVRGVHCLLHRGPVDMRARIDISVGGVEYSACPTCLQVLFEDWAAGAAFPFINDVRRQLDPQLKSGEEIGRELQGHLTQFSSALDGMADDSAVVELQIIAGLCALWVDRLQERKPLQPARCERNVPDATRQAAIRFHAATCQYCDRVGSQENDPDGFSWHIDHMRPLIAGGTNEASNLTLACRTCNLKKGSKGLEEYLRAR